MYLNIFDYKRILLRPSAAVGLIFIFSTLLPAPSSSASIQSDAAQTIAAAQWAGRAVDITPFDLKLMASGFYKITDLARARQTQSLSQIFAKAMGLQYKKDPTTDNWKNPDITEKSGFGDCEDMALWLYRELKSSGYQRVRVMVGKFEAAETAYHTWVIVPGLKGDDLILDPALQTRIWRRSDLLRTLYVPFYSFDGSRKYDHTA